MTLLAQRILTRNLSGRFDLVESDGSVATDSAIDTYINEGSKFLDRLDETQKSWASCFRFVEIGRYSASIPYCRAIKEVWAISSTAKWQLIKKDLNDLITDYLSGNPSTRNTGCPAYYTPTITRNIPANIAVEDFEAFLGFVDIPAGNANEYNTVLINVPTETKISLEIKGLFYQPKLTNDTDENFWSEVHPMLLYMATMRYIEVTNRNTQGVNDWNNSIMTDMKQLGFDLVEELISEVSQMEG